MHPLLSLNSGWFRVLISYSHFVYDNENRLNPKCLKVIAVKTEQKNIRDGKTMKINPSWGKSFWEAVTENSLSVKACFYYSNS